MAYAVQSLAEGEGSSSEDSNLYFLQRALESTALGHVQQGDGVATEGLTFKKQQYQSLFLCSQIVGTAVAFMRAQHPSIDIFCFV